MKNIGKPCAGKPLARFDEGGQGKTCSLLYVNKLLKLIGGYNLTYSGRTGNPTLLQGLLTIGTGSLIVDGLAVR